MSLPIRLLIVDDHPVVRDGLRGMFTGDPDFEVVGEARDGAEALALAANSRPDVVLMDLRMPGMDGVTAIGRLVGSGSPAKVLVLTTYDTDADVLPAIEAGATGYLLKDAPREELVRAVRAAARGEAVLSPSVAGRLMGRLRAPAEEPLSHRELEVLAMVAKGTSNREAAARLFISEATVKTHLLHVYAKLGVNDRAAAVAVAYDRGLLTPGGR
ncbi:response regulator transcription factor [Micromonospora profundi]|uniref:Response regulator transcription factor n=1 Tax=Micromonospora profundi TaxID=1420889 RepID=A0AAJ6HYK2_9ACTN|nr:response regulator transcription factor [Micromonospora profundi]NJC16008.1 DNA-binding NarL/FixJ family response regulator [Micromonospora profundi]WLS47433.1 response regulator transcription factor [Micromonospora profundi]